jgi:NAD(P)H-dependent FMN reductase
MALHRKRTMRMLLMMASLREPSFRAVIAARARRAVGQR